jgi:hypothetical protein
MRATKVGQHGKNILTLFVCTCVLTSVSMSQHSGLYPPFTKWYQDPLGMRPLQLSTAVGFAWATVAVTTSLIFTKKDSAVSKKMSAFCESGFGGAYKSPYTSALSNGIGLMYGLRKWLSVGASLNSFHFKDKLNNTWALGIMPFGRWYVYKTDSKSIFFHYGGGVSYSAKRFPLTGTGWDSDTGRTGTQFNLLSRYGVGMELHLARHASLQCGIGHFHLSNGNMAGIKRNPSHDSNGVFVGLFYN